MILFKNVSYKNFLAAGNNPIKINLESNETTLIVGQNGAGKSTIIEAIVFALFNKSFRKVNKNQLINSINEKDCVVEVEFSIGSVDWKVRRGIKPTIFEIYRNDNLLDQSSSAIDQQKWFEQSVLKLNYKSFTQIVVLGSSTFVPFMQLTASSRREIIEDLLDIRIFSTMNVLLKDRIKSVNEDLKNYGHEIVLIKEKITMKKEHISSIENSTSKSLQSKQNKILDFKKNIDFVTNEIKVCTENIETKTNKLKKYDGIEDKIKKLEKHLTTQTNLISRTEKEKKFFEDNDICPKCDQSISNDLKNEKIESSESVIKKAKTDCDLFTEHLKSASDLIAKQSALNKDITELNWQIKNNYETLNTINKFIDDINEEIKELENDSFNIESEKEKLQEVVAEGVTIKNKIVELKEQQHHHEIVSSLLKDTGIKSMIIKKYLPVMNQLINKYLQSLDFYVNFTLDEEFNESIKSRYRDDFTYSSFSEGEKMRIDLALMFTWRSIAKLKNSASTNLLILDEVFDSSLDVAGTEDFLRIIRTVNEDTNIFIISHKGDVLMDKFDRVMKFEKVKNFSKMSIS